MSGEMMMETGGESEPQRRRSSRLSPLQVSQLSAQKMAPDGAALVKRSITVRKIAPRKTTLAPSQHNKENTPKRAVSEGVELKKQKLSTPDNVQEQSTSAGRKQKKSTFPSPILPSPPYTTKTRIVQTPRVQTPKAQTLKAQTPRAQTPRSQTPRTQKAQTPKAQTPKAQTQKAQTPRSQTQKAQTQKAQTQKAQTPRSQTPRTQKAQTPKAQTPKAQTLKAKTPKAQSEPQDQQPAVDPEDAVWSSKVRRSYSRLSDKSLHSPNSRLTLFGFAKLQTPEVMGRGAGQNKSSLSASGSFTTLASFTSLLEDEDCAAGPDPNIPGVALVKEKKRRRKVQQIDSNELDALAAKMNAEFEEAEGFELLVE